VRRGRRSGVVQAMGEYAHLAPSGSPVAHAAPSNQIVDLPIPTGAQHVSDFDAQPNYMSEFVERPCHELPAAAAAPGIDMPSGAATETSPPPAAEGPTVPSYTDAMAKAQSGVPAPTLPYLDSTNSDNEFYAGQHVPASLRVGGAL
jgi:hypothetical protein